MLGTLCSSLLLLLAAGVVGQAVFVLAGRREWTPLAPAVGFAVLLALSWASVRLPGEGTAAAIALGIVLVTCVAVAAGSAGSLRASLPRDGIVVLAALLFAALPFVIEGRFGILGTGLNPDLSQHLFAADRLADAESERLIEHGYPLGPHALVVAVSSLGPSLVEAFNGLMIATAIAACLAVLAALEGLSAPRRIVGALVVGFAYLFASSHVQGAFKETLEALLLLAFALTLRETVREGAADGSPPRALRALPLAALAIGSVYAYSFPGLVWLAAAALAWAAFELAFAVRRGGAGEARRLLRAGAPSALVGLGVLALALAPEVGRMIDFAGFETFDPEGAGLGNLFDRLSPLEALGPWPSGDFRVEPGGGSVPAVVFYLGAALGLTALGFGLAWSLRRGERALVAALAAASALWLFSLLAGTPYQESKALVLAAPLVALVCVKALLARPGGLFATAYCLAAAGSAALVLVNGPVGPREYSPVLAELRPKLLGDGSVLVLAPAELLAEQHGRDYLVWELRGNRVCVEARGASDAPPRRGIASEIVIATGDAVEPEEVLRNRSTASGPGPCPLIPDGARADPAVDG